MVTLKDIQEDVVRTVFSENMLLHGQSILTDVTLINYPTFRVWVGTST